MIAALEVAREYMTGAFRICPRWMVVGPDHLTKKFVPGGFHHDVFRIDVAPVRDLNPALG